MPCQVISQSFLSMLEKLHTCRRYEKDNEAHRLRFHSDEDLNAGEIVVFFSKCYQRSKSTTYAT